MKCGTPNPNFSDQTSAWDEAVASAMSQSEDAVIECPKCHYIHIGTNIRSIFHWKSLSISRRFGNILVCNGCGSNIPEPIKLPRGLPIDDFLRYIQAQGREDGSDGDDFNNDDEDDRDGDKKDDDDDVMIIPDAEQPQIKDKEGKKAEAVEKAMADHELVPYHNRFILLMKDQTQHKQSCSVEQLNEYFADLFYSLQYKNDQSSGKIPSGFFST